MQLNFDILDNPRFSLVVKHYAKACAASREHSAIAADALDKFGDHGAQISGCVRDHFPIEIKQRLRDLAREVSEHMDKAHQARPYRVHASTVYRIGRLVATRDGCGFYGPAKIEGES